MTKYWLVVTTPKNFGVSASEEVNFAVDGFKKGCLKRVEKIERCDKFVCYITDECVFGATYKATSTFYTDYEKLVFADEKEKVKVIYPLRLRTEKILVLRDNMMLDARRVIGNLPCVHNKKPWGWFVHHSLREISKEDFEYIENEMKKQLHQSI